MRMYLAIFLLGAGLAICANNFLTIDDALNQTDRNPLVATVEAQSPRKIQTQISEDGLTRKCDPDNGTLIYESRGHNGWGFSPAIAIIPNGCAKTVR